MSKPEQVLQIEPHNELRFRGPFNTPVTSYMKLTNPSDKKVMFKIKTTAPKKYCVRPNSGTLEPNTSTEIAICLQPFLFDPAEKNKHKFMVQTVYAPDSGEINFDRLWKEISADQLMDSKLKCVFEWPVEQQNESHDDTNNKASPKQVIASNVPNSAGGGAPDELQKAAQEVQQLREEESNLRQENLRLKEEILLLKVGGGGGGGASSGSARVQQANRYAPPAVQQQNIPISFVLLAVVVGVVGIIFGKFVL